MQNVEYIDIIVSDSDGSIHQELKAAVAGECLFGTEIRVMKRLCESTSEIVVLSILMIVPLTVMKRIFKRFTDEWGDIIYSKLREFIRDMVVRRKSDFKFSLQIPGEKNGHDLKVSLTASIIDISSAEKALNLLIRDGLYIFEQMDLPSESAKELRIDYDVCTQSVLSATALDWTNRREYTFDMAAKKWNLIYNGKPTAGH